MATSQLLSRELQGIRVTIFSEVHYRKVRDNQKLQKRRFQPGKEKLHQEISEILSEAAQRSCGISILGDFKIHLDKALSNPTKVTGADQPQQLPP